MELASKNTDGVIFISGLKAHEKAYWPVLAYWRVLGYNAQIFEAGWETTESLDQKLDRLHLFTLSVKSQSRRTSLIGASAGGSLALDYFAVHQNSLHKGITACSRLRRGELEDFDLKTSSSNSFHQAVIRLEDQYEPQMSQAVRKRILTLSGKKDNTVPRNTSMILEAKNLVLPTIGHFASIAYGLFIWGQRLSYFLRH